MIPQRAPRLLKEIGRASHKLDAARAELADKREALIRLARSVGFLIIYFYFIVYYDVRGPPPSRALGEVPFHYLIIVALCLSRWTGQSLCV